MTVLDSDIAFPQDRARYFFLTWFFNNTRGSLLFPVLFHISFNIVNVAIFPVTGSVGAFAVFLVLQFMVMLVTLPALSKMSQQGTISTARAPIPKTLK